LRAVRAAKLKFQRTKKSVVGKHTLMQSRLFAKHSIVDRFRHQRARHCKGVNDLATRLLGRRWRLRRTHYRLGLVESRAADQLLDEKDALRHRWLWRARNNRCRDCRTAEQCNVKEL